MQNVYQRNCLHHRHCLIQWQWRGMLQKEHSLTSRLLTEWRASQERLSKVKTKTSLSLGWLNLLKSNRCFSFLSWLKLSMTQYWLFFGATTVQIWYFKVSLDKGCLESWDMSSYILMFMYLQIPWADVFTILPWLVHTEIIGVYHSNWQIPIRIIDINASLSSPVRSVSLRSGKSSKNEVLLTSAGFPKRVLRTQTREMILWLQSLTQQNMTPIFSSTSICHSINFAGLQAKCRWHLCHWF